MRGQKMKITAGRVRLAASDVANFLACRRLTQLDLLGARGELRPPREFDIGFQDLVRRGEVHERAVLERFRADGLDVADVSGAQNAAGATREAIHGVGRELRSAAARPAGKLPLPPSSQVQALAFTRSANIVHAPAGKASSGPSGSLLPRTVTAGPPVPTSAQAPPLLPL